MNNVTARPPRVVVENVQPSIDCGLFPIKRTPGEEVAVTADIHADGHDVLAGLLRYRRQNETLWTEVPLTNLPNDVWEGRFIAGPVGFYEYQVVGWIDSFGSWKRDLGKKSESNQDISSDLEEGAIWLEKNIPKLGALTQLLRSPKSSSEKIEAINTPEVSQLIWQHGPRQDSSESRIYRLNVERERARYGAWYEFFPRSSGADRVKGGTLREAAEELSRIADMGFDVVYLPPIHPIGSSFRKGPNNSTTAGPQDPGSPWGIGAKSGGHTAVHPDLGTIDDFRNFVQKARKLNLEVALDLAFQCSPDHPYAKEHREWFRHRPDGSIKYAENPPKKYEDIYPFDFENEAWESLWKELLAVTLYWVQQGVEIFRVDNPHTKPYRFWEWLIAGVRKVHPNVIFLAEAFTRPKVMAHLAKLGFSQSYSYFTWRNEKWELEQYFAELTQTPLKEYMRSNLFTNTPDILHHYLQTGGRPAFQIRVCLAATLGASYGIYGPAFEVCEGRAVPGTEEYLDSEKYQLRAWDVTPSNTIIDWIRRLNQIRRGNAALKFDHRLVFHPVSNDALVCYSKTTPNLSNIILTVVNVNPSSKQAGHVQLNLDAMGIPANTAFNVEDLLTNAQYTWQGSTNYVELDPFSSPAHVFRIIYAKPSEAARA